MPAAGSTRADSTVLFPRMGKSAKKHSLDEEFFASAGKLKIYPDIHSIFEIIFEVVTKYICRPSYSRYNDSAVVITISTRATRQVKHTCL